MPGKPTIFLSLVVIVLLVWIIGSVALVLYRRTRLLGVALLFLLPGAALVVTLWLYLFAGPPAVLHTAQVAVSNWTHDSHDSAVFSWESSRTLPQAAESGQVAFPSPKAEAEEDPAPVPPATSEGAASPAAAEAAGKPAAATATPPLRRPRPASPPPEWVGAPPRRTETGYQMSVATDPFATPLECERQLPETVRNAVAQYVALYLGDPQAASTIELPWEFVRTEIVKAQWEEPYESSVGPMVRRHALLVFDKQVNARIDEAYHQAVVEQRVGRLATAVAGVLAVLAAAWSYLRLDLATAGRYRWALRLVAATAILALVAAGWAILG